MQESYGWYASIVTLAESGVFNLQGMTAIQSACKANLYEAMFYLAFKTAKNRTDAIT